jgi:hypothetical protein
LTSDSAKKKPIKYKGFPLFREWAMHAVNEEKWEQAIKALKDESYIDILQRIRLIIKDAAAEYKGTLETPDKQSHGLLVESISKSFDFDLNINLDLAIQTQLIVCDYVMDFAITGKNMSKSWLCKLHYLICSPPQNHAGSKAVSTKYVGKYKDFSNKIGWKDGTSVYGAPLKKTTTEMRKYTGQLRSKAFVKAHPILQASYAHYCLVAIHPFANGNGRVARLIAFYFIYRSSLIPSVFLNQNRIAYALALRSADLGNFQPFINLVLEKSIEAADQIKERIRFAFQQV